MRVRAFEVRIVNVHVYLATERLGFHAIESTDE